MTHRQTPRVRWARACWPLLVCLLLLAWGVRVCLAEEVPPGWRDDELIEIHVLAGEVLAGHFPIYFTGASGHEPLYHYLHAGLHALLGYNVLSGHLVSVAFGLLNVALTYVLARRLLMSAPAAPRAASLSAALAAAGSALSFWSLMYSRFGLRHISAVTFSLLFLYWLWRAFERPQPRLRDYIVPGLALGAGLYTYFASRLVPVLLVVFGLYLLIVHRVAFRRHWRGLALVLAIAAVMAVPLAWAIGGMADARISELAVPLRELAAGNVRPLLEGTWATLGMFHAAGDPEWLYNIAGRPLFNVPGAILMWGGMALCAWRWKQPRYGLLAAWFWLALAPAFVSIPPASLSHTIVAEPAVAILVALATVEVVGWLRRVWAAGSRTGARLRRALAALGLALLGVVLASNVYRNVRDYFVVWPQRGMVRYLYRADYREASQYLAAHPGVTAVAVGSTLLGPWDRLALSVDSAREDVAARFFNPERALVWAGGESTAVLLPSYPLPRPPIADWLAEAGACPEMATAHVSLCSLPAPGAWGAPLSGLAQQASAPLARFANGLELVGAAWAREAEPAPGQEGVLLMLWRAGPELDLPDVPLVANPPPPGVYAGSRLAVFAHLLSAEGELAASDDGLWVDPVTLRAGDWFLQVHRFTPAADGPTGPYVIDVGLYDPLDGRRVPVLDASEQVANDAVLLAPSG